MVVIASNETAESLHGQQLMESSWVVLNTSVPPAWALLEDHWSLLTISPQILPIFCFAQFKWRFYPLNIFHIIWTLVCSPVWITTLLFPCCFGLHKCSQNESYKEKNFFIDHSIYKNISLHIFLCFKLRCPFPRSCVFTRTPLILHHNCKKRIKNRKKINSEESLSLLVEKLSELFYINLAVAILWKYFDIFSYFGAKYKGGTNMQPTKEGVIKRSWLPIHKRELFLLGKIKRHFYLVKVCQQLLLLSFRHFAESGFFVKFFAYLELPPLLAKTLLMFLVYLNILPFMALFFTN